MKVVKKLWIVLRTGKQQANTDQIKKMDDH